MSLRHAVACDLCDTVMPASPVPGWQSSERVRTPSGWLALSAQTTIPRPEAVEQRAVLKRAVKSLPPEMRALTGDALSAEMPTVTVELDVCPDCQETQGHRLLEEIRKRAVPPAVWSPDWSPE